nr:hypothetical protein asmbl_4 [uncultured bacterium]
MKTFMIQRQTTGDLPADIAAHRRHGVSIRQVLQGLQHQHRRGDLTRQTRPARRTRKQIGELLRREHLMAMLSQKREHTASRDQMPNQGTSVHQIGVTTTNTLHLVIFPAGLPDR